MSDPRYLVTGGAGFIGSHIVEALHARGAAVRVLDNFSTGTEANLRALPGELDLVRGDIRDLETVRAAMRGIEVIFHEAAIASVQQSLADPVGTLAVNLVGTQHVLAAAREAGARRVIFACSAAVYGNEPHLPKREDMAPQPISPYAIHKLAGEQLCHVYAELLGLETVALRYFNVFGPRQDPSSEYSGVISRFLAAVHAGQPPIVYGDGEQTRDFVYVGDIARANLLAAEVPEAAGQTFNLGSGTQTSLNEMLAIISDTIGRPLQTEYRAARPGDIRHSVADISKATHVLGYQPETSFAQGIGQIIQAQLSGGERTSGT